MREVYQLRKKIESTDELLSVVRTMKTMAAVNIRQFEAAVSSVRDYMETVELSFRVALEEAPELVRTSTRAAGRPVGAVVFGSDQGMCGAFNERIAEHAETTLRERGLGPEDCSFVLAGHRLAYHFEGAAWDVSSQVELPSAVEGASSFVRRLMSVVDAWREQENLERIWLYYNEAGEGAKFEPTLRELLPIDHDFVESIAEEPWDSRTEPMMSVDVDTFIRSLVDEYLYVGFFRACAESLASENAARLAAMQRAQKNISDRLEELRQAYRRTRQSSITAEILDIVGGYSALEESSG